MAVGGCLEGDVEVCEILVCMPGDANPGLYTRLRFALLASSWLPIPLGIGLWSALHVVMLVGASVCWALMLVLSFLLFDVLLVPYMAIVFWIIFGLFAVLSVVRGLVFFVLWFCWSVVGYWACHAPIGQRRGHYWWIPHVYADVKAVIGFLETQCGVGVPCMRGSYYRESKDQKWESWTRWWEEVVHSHEAIAL